MLHLKKRIETSLYRILINETDEDQERLWLADFLEKLAGLKAVSGSVERSGGIDFDRKQSKNDNCAPFRRKRGPF